MIFFIIAIDDFVLVKKIEPKWQKNFFNFSFTMHHRNDVCRMIGLQKKSICFSANSCLKKKEEKDAFVSSAERGKKNKMAEKFGGHIEFLFRAGQQVHYPLFFCLCVCVCVCNNKNISSQPKTHTHTHTSINIRPLLNDLLISPRRSFTVTREIPSEERRNEKTTNNNNNNNNNNNQTIKVGRDT